MHFPVYGSATKVPESFYGRGPQDGVTPPMMQFNMQSAFYAFNLVANWAYSRWDLIYPEVYSEITRREALYWTQIQEIDREAALLYSEQGPTAAIELVTNYSVQAGNSLVSDWNSFFGYLFGK